jgi:hypothetical protein
MDSATTVSSPMVDCDLAPVGWYPWAPRGPAPAITTGTGFATGIVTGPELSGAGGNGRLGGA